MAPPVVGVVGGGQLARMLAEAATPLGIHLRVLAAPTDEGAAEVAPDVVSGSPWDPDALRAFAATVDVMTFDHENVDHAALEELEQAGVAVRPGVGTLRFSDKAHQRRSFSTAGLPVPDFLVLGADEADAAERAMEFAEAHDRRVVVKASRGGYDGRGVWMPPFEDLGHFVAAWSGAPLVLEPHLDLLGEAAVLVARRPSGQARAWPVLETVQVDGMCDEVVLPAPLGPELSSGAVELGLRVAEVTGAVGVLAVELFVVDGGDGRTELLVNEIAPRVHNSGHLTIEGCATSQFEQHLRAVLDWPLGPTGPRAAVAVMANVVAGPDTDPRNRQAEALAAVPEAHVHLYGKSPRPARKVGHVTVLGTEREATRERARIASELLAGVGGSTP